MRVSLLSIAIILAIIAGFAVSPSFMAVAGDVPMLSIPTGSISTANVPAPPKNNSAAVPLPPHTNNTNNAVDNASSMAASLPHGMRAVSVPAAAGLIGHMAPGDHVDVLFTHNAPISTEVLLSNVPVLATNAGKNDTSANITVEATSTQVQKLAMAEKAGTLSLALRSAADKDDDAALTPASLDSTKPAKTAKHLTKTHAVMPGDEVVKVIRGVGGTQESKE